MFLQEPQPPLHAPSSLLLPFCFQFHELSTPSDHLSWRHFTFQRFSDILLFIYCNWVCTGDSSPALVQTKPIKQHYTVVQHNTIKRKQHNTIKRKHKIICT
jgi:hypothetical protein